MQTMMVTLREETFDPVREIAVFEKSAGDVGAVVTFIGKVRGHHDGMEVSGLTLEHYPGMTERSISAIITRACARWTLDAVLVIHRTGFVRTGEAIVLVCTASAHRRAAFEAADYLMDYLKSEALFWKKEHRADGDHWIEPRDGDYRDRQRWEKEG